MAEKAKKPKVSNVFPDAQTNSVKELLDNNRISDACRILTELRYDLANDVFEIPKKIRSIVEKGDPNGILMDIVLTLGGRRDALSNALQTALPVLRQMLVQQGFNMLDIIAAQLVGQGVLDLE